MAKDPKHILKEVFGFDSFRRGQGDIIEQILNGQDVIGIMRMNALVHTAVVSDMPEDVFHDVMEGLGILASLPTSPAAEDARRVTRLLTELQA